MRVRVLLVDDEPPARRKVRALLGARPEVEIVGEAGNGLEAVDAISRLSPDLVFLDIQMPAMTGFEVIEAVGPDAMPAVVFVTAYDEHALEAFDVQAVDYLLKPIQEERFAKAFERAVRLVSAGRERPVEAERLSKLLSGVRPEARYLSRLVVRKGERLLFVHAKEIVHLTAEGNYVTVHATHGTYSLRESLTHLETRLDPDRFARIHRSEIVAVDAVKEIEPWFHGDYTVVLRNGEKLRLSRRYQARLLGGAS